MAVRFEWQAAAVTSKPRPMYVELDFGLHTIHLVGGVLFVIGRLGKRSEEEMTLAIFDMHKMEWSWVTITGPDVPYSWCHASYLYADSINVFGGTTRWSLDSNEVFQLDLTMLEWRKANVGELKPEKRKYHTGQFIERKKQFVCFGGYQGGLATTSYFQDVWALDVIAMRWHKPKLKGTLPVAHGQASCVVGMQIYIFGGKHVDQPNHSLCLLNCENSVFQCTVLRSCANTMGRVFPSLTYINGRLLLYGGYDARQEDRNELFVMEEPYFEPHLVVYSKNALTEYKYSSREHVKCIYAHCALVRGKELWIFGGFNNLSSPFVLREL